VSHSIESNATERDGQLSVNTGACQNMTDACVQEPAKYGVDAEDLGDSSSCEGITAEATLKGCEASVGEYEQCLTQLVQVLRERVAKITCARAEELAQEDEGLDLGNIAQCQSFTSKCPDVQLVHQ
jgi:hypothetical protein